MWNQLFPIVVFVGLFVSAFLYYSILKKQNKNLEEIKASQKALFDILRELKDKSEMKNDSFVDRIRGLIQQMGQG